MQTKAFLSTLDNERIVKAIREAETRSRGEVRVHVSNQPVEDAEKAAAEQFEKLGMTATKERNGVLVFVAPLSQKFAVVGDRGIHETLPPGFWAEVAGAMQADFREGRFTDGIVKGLARLGDALSIHFPRPESARDVNELKDEVTED